MAYNLTSIITKVRQRVRDTGYSTSEITNYINDTQNDVFNEYNLRFMQDTQNYTVTVDVADITNGSGLPAHYVQAIQLLLTTEGLEKTIEYRDFSLIEQEHPDPADITRNPAGVPMYWYIFDDTINLYPAPAEAYTLTLKYAKKPTELTSGDDVPEIPSQFEELLVSGAAYRVLQVKDNYDQASIHQNKYDEILQKFVVRYSTPQIGTPMRMNINRHTNSKRSF